MYIREKERGEEKRKREDEGGGRGWRTRSGEKSREAAPVSFIADRESIEAVNPRRPLLTRSDNGLSSAGVYTHQARAASFNSNIFSGVRKIRGYEGWLRVVLWLPEHPARRNFLNSRDNPSASRFHWLLTLYQVLLQDQDRIAKYGRI